MDKWEEEINNILRENEEDEWNKRIVVLLREISAMFETLEKRITDLENR